jgi:hypothetical protein
VSSLWRFTADLALEDEAVDAGNRVVPLVVAFGLSSSARKSADFAFRRGPPPLDRVRDEERDRIDGVAAGECRGERRYFGVCGWEYECDSKFSSPSSLLRGK